MRAPCTASLSPGERAFANSWRRAALSARSSRANAGAKGERRLAGSASASLKRRRSRRSRLRKAWGTARRISPYARSRRSSSLARNHASPGPRRAPTSRIQASCTSASRPAVVRRARSRMRRSSFFGIALPSSPEKARTSVRRRRTATRKSCNASGSPRSSSRAHAARASSRRARAIRATAAGAGWPSNPDTRSVIAGRETPQVFGSHEPIERGRAPGHSPREVEQTGRALPELEKRVVGTAYQGADHAREIGLVPHDGDGSLSRLTLEPRDNPVHAAAWRELRDPLDAQLAISMRENCHGVERATERARGQEIYLGHELAQTQGAALHLTATLGGERPCGVLLMRARECLAIVGDGVAD